MKTTYQTYWLLGALRFACICFIIPVYFIFLLKHLNQSQWLASCVNASFFLGCAFCEVPGGAICDVLGCRKTYVLGNFLAAIALVLYAGSTTFWQFVGCELMESIAVGLVNCTLFSWVNQVGEKQGYKPEDHTEANTKAMQIALVFGAITACIGASLAKQDMQIPWLCAGIGIALVGTLSFFLMKDEASPKATFREVVTRTGQTMKTGYRLSMGCPQIRRYLILMFALAIAIQAPNSQWQPVFKSYFGDLSVLGYSFSLINILMAVGSFMAIPLFKRTGCDFMAIRIIFIVVGFLIAICLLVTNPIYLVSIFMLHEVLRGVIGPIASELICRLVPDKTVRTTIMSFGTLPFDLGSVAGLAASGLMPSPPLAWGLSGVFLILVALCSRGSRI
jgi:MFS family permease